DRRPALRSPRDRLVFRARRGARGLSRRRGPAPLGAGRRAHPGGQARRSGLRLLHPGILCNVRHEPRPSLDRRVTGTPSRLLRPLPRRPWPPPLLFYRRDLPMRGRVQMMLLTATALPLLVALAKIGLESGTMLPENAAALVGAGVLSVIVFPAVAVRFGRSARPLVETP